MGFIAYPIAEEGGDVLAREVETLQNVAAGGVDTGTEAGHSEASEPTKVANNGDGHDVGDEQVYDMLKEPGDERDECDSDEEDEDEDGEDLDDEEEEMGWITL